MPNFDAETLARWAKEREVDALLARSPTEQQWALLQQMEAQEEQRVERLLSELRDARDTLRRVRRKLKRRLDVP
jgi:Holliday junction resolvase